MQPVAQAVVIEENANANQQYVLHSPNSTQLQKKILLGRSYFPQTFLFQSLTLWF
jgi:hypothetical protein